jgi:D-3-phosphoglycerate dehydrogenase
MSDMNTILITTSTFGDKDEQPVSVLEASGYNIVLNPYRRRLKETEVLKLIEEHRPVGMIAGVEPLTRKVLNKGIGLKVISRCGVGMDSVDLDAAEELGIVVTNTPDATIIPVAELTLGMMLALLRGIHISDTAIRGGQWVRPMGNLLHGKTVGIIGCGRIGTHLARLLSVFGCRILGYDIHCVECEYYETAELDVLLKESDLVSLHLPYSEENHHFINRERMRAMKNGAMVVNASRGGLVDEEALLEELTTGKLGGAALDCFDEEPYSGPLREVPNTLLTGHIGSYAAESRAFMEQGAVDNLLQILGETGERQADG